MKVMLHLKTEFETVFMINGVFVEDARTVKHDSQQALYITVLPLNAALLPYTVKLSGLKAASNTELCKTITLAENDLLIYLSPRYNYVYSAKPINNIKPNDSVEQFFDMIKRGDVKNARLLMTEELSLSVTDEGLKDFFADYENIIYNDGYIEKSGNTYFLLNEKGNGTLFDFIVKDNLIDNIAEKEH